MLFRSQERDERGGADWMDENDGSWGVRIGVMVVVGLKEGKGECGYDCE